MVLGAIFDGLGSVFDNRRSVCLIVLGSMLDRFGMYFQMSFEFLL